MHRQAEQGNNLLHHGNRGEEGYEERQGETRTDGSGNNRQEEEVEEEEEGRNGRGREGGGKGGRRLQLVMMTLRVIRRKRMLTES